MQKYLEKIAFPMLTAKNQFNILVLCCVVFEFLLFLIKLSFSDTTVIEGGRERKHS